MWDYWYDGKTYSQIRIKSALLRLSKKALLEAGVEMPGETREVVFPVGVPIAESSAVSEPASKGKGRRRLDPAEISGSTESEAVATAAEGGLENEANDIREQARSVAPPERGSDLLEDRS